MATIVIVVLNKAIFIKYVCIMLCGLASSFPISQRKAPVLTTNFGAGSLRRTNCWLFPPHAVFPWEQTRVSQRWHH